MPKTRPLTTNFSKGELSPLLEGHPDLAAYFEGASTLENWLILRQGGITRWPGSRMVAEAKDTGGLDVILWPFEFSSDDAYVLEVGNHYIRIFRDKAALGVELETPFGQLDVRTIHITQSADIVFTFHRLYAPRKLSRVSDTEWVLSNFLAEPGPSFQADTDLNVSVAVNQNSGTSATFHVDGAALLGADVGRLIIIGAGRAVITSYTDTSNGVCNILDPFFQEFTAAVNTLDTTGTAMTSVAHGLVQGDFVTLTFGAQAGQIRIVTDVIDADNVTLDIAFGANQSGTTWTKIAPTHAGDWGLRLSPQTTLDPDKKSPVGVAVTLVAGAAAFRTADIGKIISIYGGAIEITQFSSTTSIKGIIRSVLGDATTADPAAAPAGAWTLEELSWSIANGFPRTGDFFQGRLYAASTDAEKTTFWGSASDSFYNFAQGITDADAVNNTIASRKVNQLLWIAENNKQLAIGTGGAELQASGSGNENAIISGTNPPMIDRAGNNGVAPIQPVQASERTLLFVDRSRRKIFSLEFNADANGNAPSELTLGAEHITKSMVRLGPLAYQARLDPRLYFCREDGQLVGLTHFPEQKVVGATRRTTQGTYGSCAVIPNANGGADQVWVVVTRTINGVEKKFIEMFEFDHEGLQDLEERPWSSLQTDCAILVSGITGPTVSVPHLAGMEVDVIKNGIYLGPHTLTGTTLTLQEDLIETDLLEIGLHYDSACISMRPAVPGGSIEGLPRSWVKLGVRLYESKGGKANGEVLEYPEENVINNTLYTGDIKIVGNGYSDDGRFEILQDEPYPMTVLCVFGTLDIGGSD